MPASTPDFRPAELRAHTAFSFNDGAVTPEALIERAADLGYESIGITDMADLGGVVRAAAMAKIRGIRAIAGAELNMDGRPIALLARNATGYRNLAALVTASRVGTWKTWEKTAAGERRGQPNITWAQLAERAEGLHLLTGPASGMLASLIRDDWFDRACAPEPSRSATPAATLSPSRRAERFADRQLAEWRDVFGDRLAVEVQLHHVDGHEAALAAELIRLAGRARVPWVAAQDPRYVDDTSRLVHDCLTALRHEMTIDDAHRAGVLHPNGEWRLLAPELLRRRWSGCESGLHEATRIASECQFDLAWMRPPLPDFPGATDGDTNSFLRARVYDGARERWGATLTEPQRRQLEHELATIKQLGFAGFFLVMWDAVRFARERRILCQGRGSAANSAVVYCLGITAVDPIKHGLLFERFLSEVRVDGKAEAPDIDVDFEHDRREEVLDYMYTKYARPHAAIACIVQTYRAPNAVQDSMRAFGYPMDVATSISKRLHRYDPLDAAVQMQERYATQAGLDIAKPRVQALLRTIRGFDRLPRLRATHVGGFVLSGAPLGDWLPIEQTNMGRTIVQFDKDDLDAIGVPKFDFLGLGGLAMLRRAFDAIEVRTGKRPQMYGLPTDDAPTYDLISRGETIGTFQIESRAQIASIVHTKPDRLYDIVVQVALIRPGPIQAKFVRPYTRRRRGQEQPVYAHPALEPIARRTQGIPIFQEQAMAVAMALGGYTGAEADELRRTMGNIRKEPRLIAALERLRVRMIDHDITPRVRPEVAQQVCEDLRSFANYGFPESHAWSFALIAYATAWLKVHYPTEFYLGLLNAWPMGFYSPATLIHDAKRHGVEVRPPCLARGDWECTVEPASPLTPERARVQRRFVREGTRANDPHPALRIGWRFVRGVSARALESLRGARAAAPFTSIADVTSRARLTRAEVNLLAQAGAFHAWEPDRRKAAWEALRAVNDTLPLAPARVVPHDVAPLTRDELVQLDYYATGITVNGHPMQAYRERLARDGVKDSREITRMPNRANVSVAGLVVIRQRPYTANGVLFLLLEDEYGFINVVVRKDDVAPNEEVVKRAQYVLVHGHIGREGNALSVVGHEFEALEAEALTQQSRDFR
ncbi:MAG: DNA polymerase III subunit alpha [Gemmatimonadetes bacterium]|nr:DNA polymerase III subunit alpha [Gemmatimonadota bacterium]